MADDRNPGGDQDEVGRASEEDVAGKTDEEFEDLEELDDNDADQDIDEK